MVWGQGDRQDLNNWWKVRVRGWGLQSSKPLTWSSWCAPEGFSAGYGVRATVFKDHYRRLKFYQRNASRFWRSFPNNVQINPNVLSAQRWKRISHQDLYWTRTSEKAPPMRLRHTRPAQDWGCNKKTEKCQENPDKSPRPLREPAPSNTSSLYWKQAKR